jgi:hypothetical protein
MTKKEPIFRTKKEEEMISVERIKHSMETIDQNFCPIHEVKLVKGKCTICGVCYTC